MLSHRAKSDRGRQVGHPPRPCAGRSGLATGDVVTLELQDGELRIRTLEKELVRARPSCAGTFRLAHRCRMKSSRSGVKMAQGSDLVVLDSSRSSGIAEEEPGSDGFSRFLARR